jgi:hypothetical protein
LHLVGFIIRIYMMYGPLNVKNPEKIVVCFSEKARDFAVLQSIQTGCLVHLAYRSVGNKAHLLGVRHMGMETINWSLSSAKVTNEWSCNFRLQYTFVVVTGITLTTGDVSGDGTSHLT